MSLSYRDLLLVMLVTILWGVHTPIMKLGVHTIEPLSLNFIRFLLTGLLFLPFAGKMLPWEDIKKLIPISLFFVCGNLMFGHVALTHITGNSFIILIQLAQPVTLILAWVFWGEKFGLITASGIFIALCGLLIVFGAPDILSAPLGAALTMVTLVSWSIGSLAMKKTGHIKPAAFLAYSYLMATPIAFAATCLLESGQIDKIREADTSTLGFVLFYQVIVMGIMSVVWAGLMARNRAQYVTPFLMLQPIFAIIGNYYINGELLHWTVFAGGLVTLLGVGIINWRLIVKRARKATT